LSTTSPNYSSKIIGSGGKSSNAGKLGSAAILNQNPIFEMGSLCLLFAQKGPPDEASTHPPGQKNLRVDLRQHPTQIIE
jgi:hypothetical protein